MTKLSWYAITVFTILAAAAVTYFSSKMVPHDPQYRMTIYHRVRGRATPICIFDIYKWEAANLVDHLPWREGPRSYVITDIYGQRYGFTTSCSVEIVSINPKDSYSIESNGVWVNNLEGAQQNEGMAVWQ